MVSISHGRTGAPSRTFCFRLLAGTWFVIGFVLAACSAPAADLPEGALVIRGGWLFDGTGDTIVPNGAIVIRDSVIHQVGAELEGVDLAGAQLIDLDDDQYLFPGIFDLHAHYAVDLFGQGRVDEDRVYPALFLANGATSTFPAGEVNPEKMRELRLRIERGEQAGPRIFSSGPYFGSAREGWDPEMTAEEIREEVEYWYARGARHFKAKGIGTDQLEALIEAAHAHGATVTGHLDSGFRGSVNPRDAIRMGIDRIEHFEGGDAMTPDRSAYASLVEMTPDMPEFREIVELYIENGVNYDATLSAYGYFGEQDPEVYTYFQPEPEFLTPYTREVLEAREPRRPLALFEEIYRVKPALVEAFYSMGGGDLITLGTDHPSWGQYFSGFGVHRELHMLARSGIPNAAVLRIATINGARALGVDDRLGTIEEGKLADVVIVNGNPLEDIRNTRNVRVVIRNGETYEPEALLESVRGKLGPVDASEVRDW